MSKGKRILSICLKVSDGFNGTFLEDGVQDGDYEGYVPNFFPGNHYGDYVELDIDIDTGMIVNWNKPTKADIKVLKNH